MGEILDGKAVAQAVRDEVRAEVVTFRERYTVAPGLATVLVGADPASATYVRNKQKACAAVGLESFAYELVSDTAQQDLVSLVRQLNQRPEVHGILVQLPLPPAIDAAAVLAAIDPAKDVDGLHPSNQAALVMGHAGLRPCTPLGVMRLLAETGIDPKGANAVVVGRSSLVGKPVAFLLLEQHATVTICHSRTRDLAGEVARADILIAAIGRAEQIRGDWVKPGSVVIDVGINRTPQGKLIGDVEFAAARSRAAFITPVPGGVGPMTISMLLGNTLQAASHQERVRAAG